MLLGNKTDKEIERQVQKGVGERLAKVCFILLSSKFCTNQCRFQTTQSLNCVFFSSVINGRNMMIVESEFYVETTPV